MKDEINIIGGGLAGCEAAYQIAKRGIKVNLYEMKPNKFSPAHSNKDLAEIVCILLNRIYIQMHVGF
jgi:methylenetetrahydrofolate--tRNA-(uracil-5-)-methyltransferase